MATSYSDKLRHPKWQKKRLEILNRDGFCCRTCFDDEETLHVHHMVYQGENPWETENKYLVTLCEYCHEVENGFNDEIKKLNYNIKHIFYTQNLRMINEIFETNNDVEWWNDMFNINLVYKILSKPEYWNIAKEAIEEHDSKNITF